MQKPNGDEGSVFTSLPAALAPARPPRQGTGTKKGTHRAELPELR